MADVVVVGGGVMGLLCARELARAGRKVLLLEKGRAGSGANPEFRETGVLLLALEEGQARELQAEPGRHGFGEARWLDPPSLREAEPALSSRLPGALLLPGGSVEPPRLPPP